MANLRRRKYNYNKEESGQAMVEFAIVFPVLFLLILTIIQTSMSLIAMQMVKYAAYCSARSAIVWIKEDNISTGTVIDKASQAAYIACIPISPSISIAQFSESFPSGDLSLPGLIDSVAAYGSKYIMSRLLTHVTIFNSSGKNISKLDQSGVNVYDDITVEVVHSYSLRIPIVNKIFFWTNLGARQSKKGLSLDPYSWAPNLGKLGAFVYLIPIRARCTMTVEGFHQIKS
ncbi:MAG: pilus assembly protein [Desulfobacteraceae bacterium]|jgi:Flp pilus assembly protein TadG|nr:pilus assembly protein [Desulfobacteraceae bacterium]